ncbi:MAG: pseudouridine synthase [Burkholderiaceae bacterium]
MTLDRLLQSQGFGSRRQCRALVTDGRVLVNGAPCDDPSRDFPTDGLVLTVDGIDWPWRERVYLALHKPAGVECSHRPQHHPSVFSLLPAPLRERGVECVGRLDQDTTGLLLMSDDGAFIHAVGSPKKAVGKTYRVTVRHPLTPAMLDALRTGVLLHGESAPLAAQATEAIGETVLLLTIAEGKYHQVKRMVAAAGNRVEQLHRVAVGPWRLDESLPPGAWQWIDPTAAGGE